MFCVFDEVVDEDVLWVVFCDIYGDEIEEVF